MKLDGLKVFVYFNLRKKVFSIRAMEGEFKGLVVAHSKRVSLTDARFKVSEAGRQRVIREQRKNVHAGVVGRVCEESLIDGVEITYNPYLYSSFVHKASGEPIREAEKVLLVDKRIFV